MVDVTSVKEGLSKVEKGEVFAYIDNSVPIMYEIQKNFLGTLSIVGRTTQKMKYGIASRNDEIILNQILQKAIDLIGQMEISSKTLNRLTDKLKDKVQDYRKSIKSMQDSGLKVKLGQTPDQISAAFYKWQKDRNKAINKQQITKINPAWQKYIK